MEIADLRIMQIDFDEQGVAAQAHMVGKIMDGATVVAPYVYDLPLSYLPKEHLEALDAAAAAVVGDFEQMKETHEANKRDRAAMTQVEADRHMASLHNRLKSKNEDHKS